MADVLVILILVLVVGAAAAYIIKEKKKGTKCIGCPYSGTCASKKSTGGCSCHTDAGK